MEAIRRGDARRRILFVCMGNSCRSPMAEAFARALGGDVLTAESAGLLPSDGISKCTRQVMKEKNTPIRKRAPRLLTYYNLAEFDLVVNMTGLPLTFANAGEVIEWAVSDPAGMKLAQHRAVRDQIEALVRNLVANLRFRDGFAPRRDRAQSASAGLRAILLMALVASPLLSTPIYDEPADFDGWRTGAELVSTGRGMAGAWIRWEIDPAPGGGYFYHYEFGGFRRAGPWLLYIESEAPSGWDWLFLGRTFGHGSVSFHSSGAPVWGNFILAGGLRGAVFNAGWFRPDSPFAADFIARPGPDLHTETPEPSAIIPLAVLCLAVWRRRAYSGTAAIQ